jgi:hypothetical protein
MKFRLEDGIILNTDKAEASWQEAREWDGRNHISVNTGSQWNHQTLYLSAKGRYYLVHESQWQGSQPTANLITDEEAASWLLRNEHKLPEKLQQHEENIVE